MILKRVNILKTPSNKYIIEASFFLCLFYDYNAINDSWFLIYQMNGWLVGTYQLLLNTHTKKEQKLIKKDKPSQVDQRHMKVNSYQKQQLD